MSIRFALVLIALVAVSPLLHAQSLTEAAAAGAKARGVTIVEPAKVITNKDLSAVPPPAPASALPTIVTTSDAPVVHDTVAAHRDAADLLLHDRIQALAVLADQRDQSAAQYRDACDGKSTSAGWLLRGELIMTPNAQTAACRTIASDHAHQAAAFTREHAAITETARTHGVFPGLLRELFNRAGLPD